MATSELMEKCRAQISQPNLLLVEGEDDKRFFSALVRQLELQRIQIIPLNGRNNLGGTLQLIRGESSVRFDLETLGIIVDADKNASARFQSVRDTLIRVGWEAPQQPGVWTEGGRPRTGVFVLPDCSEQGELEDLCIRAVAEHEKAALECVDQYLDCLRKKNVQLSSKLGKVKLQVFLASRQKPGLRLGEAAEASEIRLDSEAFEKVRSFLLEIR
ncbi:hypothetical protein A7Q09_05500 [Methylacidiphilum sp. Yel]|uniref:DUF4435 domain-containing protein n=1 Tax=Methylacidiphilum sp. Yel TaxID=1847730 RepID=UPI001102104D|nr:DUF4435 domain-containing protein [Methylacidiphilum sp. Yel]TFE69347.1 hypothetical protein A7Q09_05500 [Methylacidiphilum sp. Yel]